MKKKSKNWKKLQFFNKTLGFFKNNIIIQILWFNHFFFFFCFVSKATQASPANKLSILKFFYKNLIFIKLNLIPNIFIRISRFFNILPLNNINILIIKCFNQNATHSSSVISPELSVSTARNNSSVFSFEKFPFL